MNKPDFSGEWILNRRASTLSPAADAVQTGFLHIDHHDPTFRCKGSFASTGKPFEYEYELLSDGRDVVSTHHGVQRVSRLQWDGDALLVFMRTQRPDGDQTISFRYDLIDAGRRIRATEQLRGTDHDQDNVWVFERR
jgi:hypothetical protein